MELAKSIRYMGEQLKGLRRTGCMGKMKVAFKRNMLMALLLAFDRCVFLVWWCHALLVLLVFVFAYFFFFFFYQQAATRACLTDR